MLLGIVWNDDPKRIMFLLLNELMKIVSCLLLLLLNIQLVLQFLLRFPQNQVVFHLPVVDEVLVLAVVAQQVLDVVLRQLRLGKIDKVLRRILVVVRLGLENLRIGRILVRRRLVMINGNSCRRLRC